MIAWLPVLSVMILGFNMRRGGLSVLPRRTWLRKASTCKQLLCFRCFMNFYHHFIHDHSKVTVPLTRLRLFHWSERPEAPAQANCIMGKWKLLGNREQLSRTGGAGRWWARLPSSGGLTITTCPTSGLQSHSTPGKHASMLPSLIGYP